MNKRFVALGDLIADCYYKGKEIIRFAGGGSRFNVMANMAELGYQCAVLGGRGNDEIGEILACDLSNIGVDTSNMYILPKRSRSFNLSLIEERLPDVAYICSKNSPIDGRVTWYENNSEDLNRIKPLIDQEDVIILDEVDSFSRQIISELGNDLVIDIGNINHLKKISDEEIVKLRNKFEIMQLNERVATYLMERFDFKSIQEIYNLLSPRLLVITYGNKGAAFLRKNSIVIKELKKVAKEVDPTGAGDAFLSALTGYYYDCDKDLYDGFEDAAFAQATDLTSRVVQYYGARGHIHQSKKKTNAKKKELRNIS